MPGLAVARYADLKEHHGSGSAVVAQNKIVSRFSCPQGARSKIWDLKTGELNALYGQDYMGEWFWLNDKAMLKSTIMIPRKK